MTKLKNYHQLIETEIKRQKFGDKPKSLYEPIRYIMQLGGKRLRPHLALLSYALYKNDPPKIITQAIALEVFHNFTLLHDDIMDKAPLRRGKKTVHEKWNINTAILSGDVMLVKVYDLFLTLDEKKLKEVLKKFNRCAVEVCEGQQWDMEFETRTKVTEAQYIEMIRLKTAVLLGFSLELGAVLADAPEQDQIALRELGISIGIGFQLKDDLLDVYGDQKKIGKQVGGDILANKKTFLLIKTLERARGKDKHELQGWLAAKKFNKQKKVKAITALYNKLEIKSLTEQKIDDYFSAGLKLLDGLNVETLPKKALEDIALRLMERQH